MYETNSKFQFVYYGGITLIGDQIVKFGAQSSHYNNVMRWLNEFPTF